MSRAIAVQPGEPVYLFETPGILGPWKNLAPWRALRLPLAFALALATLALTTSTATPPLLWSMLGAAATMIAWWAVGMVAAGRRDQTFDLVIVLRKQHYIQACAHLSIFAYWGWYWPEVYHSAHLIAAQILFAYAFDMLLVWSRRREYTLGFGLFPIVFSTNLFLWFKADWFYLQFLMIATAFTAKELIRWNREGRSTHVFNPSAFPLAIFSLGLILTGTTYLTWGAEIANTFELPPHIRLWIFAIGLPGQFLFGVVTMTMSAVATVVGFGLAYYAIFHTYFFVDAFVPAAVFLGMHLLFTDPSTSPRSELGRIFFGVLYGTGVIVLYAAFEKLGIPSFYDKLLPVLLLNLLVPGIEAATGSSVLRPFDPTRIGRSLSPRRRNLAYIAIWVVIFVAQTDPLGAYRPRRWVPFWQQACQGNRFRGCEVLGRIESKYCADGSSWACNELGILAAERSMTSAYSSEEAFARACALGLANGCANASSASLAHPGDPGVRAAFTHGPPQLAEYAVLLQEGNGLVTGISPAELLDRACVQGWADGCRRLAGVYFRTNTGANSSSRLVAALERACDLGLADSCADLGVMLQEGDKVRRDTVRGSTYLQRACGAGVQRACDRINADHRATPATRTP